MFIHLKQHWNTQALNAIVVSVLPCFTENELGTHFPGDIKLDLAFILSSLYPYQTF